MIIMFMPDGESFIVSSKKDADFAETAQNFDIPLKIDPK